MEANRIALGEQTTQQTQFVTVKGAKIAYYESGHGTPILLLHGSPDTHAMWLPVIARLDRQARCIALDLPGFGESTLPADFALTLDNMADFVHELLASLSITEPLVLVTTDFGGHYGMAFAAKYPDRVRGVAVSNTNFFHDYHWHFSAQLYRTPVLGEVLLATSSRKVISSTLKSISPAMPDSYIDSSFACGFGSPSVRKTILRMYRERQPQDFVGWEDRWLEFAKRKPVIVLWGDKDPFITPAFADRFGGKQVHHFPEYSHWLALEAPDRYADLLADWLASI
jgi:pimeloyl-ACP methyl ester carboxylesterase